MRVIPGFLFLVLATATITAERIDSLDEVLAEHQKATGEALQSIEYDVELSVSGYPATAHYVASRAGATRIDVYADGQRVFSEAFDDSNAWQWPAGRNEAKPVDEELVAALRRGAVANLYRLHERPALGYRLRFDGNRMLDGSQYWQVSSTAPDGYRETFFINTENGLIERKWEHGFSEPASRAASPLSETRFYGFRWVGNTRLSFESEKFDTASGQRISEIKIVNARVNLASPDSMAARHL